MSRSDFRTVVGKELRERGLLLVTHPHGKVMAPGGGHTTWPAIGSTMIETIAASEELPTDLTHVVGEFNMKVGGFAAEHWELTRASLIVRRSGRVVASFELKDDIESLFHAVMAVISVERHGREV